MSNVSKIIWGPERRLCSLDCIVYIYEAINKLNLPFNFSMIDIACGNGQVMDALARLFPKSNSSILDIRTYPEWRGIKPEVNKIITPVQKFIELDNKFDIVIMLDTYREWGKHDKDREAFSRWLFKNAKYFITSGSNLCLEKEEIRGTDLKGYPLEMYRL